MAHPLQIHQGCSMQTGAEAAVREAAAHLGDEVPALTLAFFSSEYNLAELGPCLRHSLPGPVIGCTTAGQLSGQGFQRGGLCLTTICGTAFSAVPFLIHPLRAMEAQVERLGEAVQRLLQDTGMQAFGFLLVDGLSEQEEVLIASLYRVLGDVPIVGGSAGDMLQFRQTAVYHEGQLLTDAAVFTLCLTSRPFRVFKHQHFLPTTKRLVITDAAPARRLVHEINGEPAVKAYARLIGKEPDQLTPADFSRYPLMLRIRDDYYVRSISGVEPDGSLKFYCAIDTGLVLTIGEGHMAADAFAETLHGISDEIGDISIMLGCDCILRRLEMEQHGMDERFSQLIAQHKVVGFSTYGEQFNAVHLNQTFTGVAIGG